MPVIRHTVASGLHLLRPDHGSLCLLIALLYCILEVQPQENLFLAINGTDDVPSEPLQPRYLAVMAGDQDMQQEKACSIVDTTDLEGDSQLSRDTCLASPRDYGVGVCNSVFAHFTGHNNGSTVFEVMARNTSDDSEGTFSSWEELCTALERVERELLMFQKILDRTLVGVYARSCQNKSFCLVAYREWLCVTRLPLFTANITNNTNTSATVQAVDGVRYARWKPCLYMCNNVAAQCPYYLPSSYQSDMPSQLDNAIVYGGHPAFSCPTNKQVEENNRSSYSVMACIGTGSGGGSRVYGVNLLCTTLTVILCMVVGIILR